MNLADELQKLQELRQSDAISDEEYAKAKEKLLASGSIDPGGAADLEQQTRLWAMLLHFSQLAGFIVPLAGLIVPIVIWQIKKTELPGIDEHGKIVANWIISELLYWILSIILMFVIIGIPMIIVLSLLGIIFPIIGGIKANNGETWKYPMSIAFF